MNSEPLAPRIGQPAGLRDAPLKNDAGHATMLAPYPYWLRYAGLGGCRRRSCRELFQHHAPKITDIERARWQRFREDVRAQRLRAPLPRSSRRTQHSLRV